MTLSQRFRGSFLISALLVSLAACGGADYSAKGAPPAADYSGGARAGAYPGGAAPSAAKADSASMPAAEAEPGDRPGLGTQWGETRDSRITSVPFERGDGSNPFATAVVYYN